MNPYTEVLFEEQKGKNGDVGIITLNRPNVLNSLNYQMIQAMYNQLQVWANDKNIKAVIIRPAPGRAFCAGGDLRSLYEGYVKQDKALAQFFHDEYRLNRFIFHFPKPYIALLDGITMGGGVGISIHGSHRVATEYLVFAMPETAIGFYPDVGGTYFLPRLNGYIGFYLGLIGVKLTSDDCIALGITQHKVAQAMLPTLIEAIADTPFEQDASLTVSRIIEKFHLPYQPSGLRQHQASIDECFSAETVEEIISRLKQSSDALCQEAAKQISHKSPTSLKVTLEALQKGKTLDFDICMQREFDITSHFLQAHDFIEGIRAIIIDKHKAPKWDPATLAGVTNNMVKKYFSPLTETLS